MASDLETTPAAEPSGPPDRLTIGRLLILTAGVAVGLGVFLPHRSDPPKIGDPELWLASINAVLAGLSLPAPLFFFRMPRESRSRMRFGGFFALAAGLGSLTMLPPAAAARVASTGASATVCLIYVLPLMALWWLMAAASSGQLRTLFRRDRPWLDRFGTLLAIAWSPLGLWHLFNFYAEMVR